MSISFRGSGLVVSRSIRMSNSTCISISRFRDVPGAQRVHLLRRRAALVGEGCRGSNLDACVVLAIQRVQVVQNRKIFPPSTV